MSYGLPIGVIARISSAEELASSTRSPKVLAGCACVLTVDSNIWSSVTGFENWKLMVSGKTLGVLSFQPRPLKPILRSRGVLDVVSARGAGRGHGRGRSHVILVREQGLNTGQVR